MVKQELWEEAQKAAIGSLCFSLSESKRVIGCWSERRWRQSRNRPTGFRQSDSTDLVFLFPQTASTRTASQSGCPLHEAPPYDATATRKGEGPVEGKVGRPPLSTD